MIIPQIVLCTIFSSRLTLTERSTKGANVIFINLVHFQDHNLTSYPLYVKFKIELI